MKLILFALLTLMNGTIADAASSEVCDKFLPCGVYEGSGNWYDVNNKSNPDGGFSERIEIIPVDKMSVNVKIFTYRDAPAEPWTDSILKFEDDGRFLLADDGFSYASGFCRERTCTISFMPAKVKREGQEPFLNTFVNIFRFEQDGHLSRFNMAANNPDPNALDFQRVQLKRKEQ